MCKYLKIALQIVSDMHESHVARRATQIKCDSQSCLARSLNWMFALVSMRRSGRSAFCADSANTLYPREDAGENVNIRVKVRNNVMGNKDCRASCSHNSQLFIFRHCPLVFSQQNCSNTSAVVVCSKPVGVHAWPALLMSAWHTALVWSKLRTFCFLGFLRSLSRKDKLHFSALVGWRKVETKKHFEEWKMQTQFNILTKTSQVFHSKSTPE